MKIKELCENTASAMSTVAMGVGPMLTRQVKNSDGTAKNALDLVSKKKKTKRKKT